MPRKLAISFDWQGGLDRERALERVVIADQVGVDSVWIPEAWGRDCFTLLTQIAERTKRIRLGTGMRLRRGAAAFLVFDFCLLTFAF